MDGSGWGEESYNAGNAGGWGEASFVEADEFKESQHTEKVPYPATVKDLSQLANNEEKMTAGKYSFNTVSFAVFPSKASYYLYKIVTVLKMSLIQLSVLFFF